MFQYLIAVKPLGFLYGSAGAFLSAENLVGKSGIKFPPDAAVMSGLILRKHQEDLKSSKKEIDKIKKELTVAGAFWAKDDDLESFYVPVPRSHIFGERIVDPKSGHKKDDYNQWDLTAKGWTPHEPKEVSNEYKWQKIDFWDLPSLATTLKSGLAKETPWRFNPFLHPKMQSDQRHVVDEDGLFLENAVQMAEDVSLIYLSTHEIPNGWYRFGGEGHLVEIKSERINPNSKIYKLLNTNEINRSFALICPAVWGTNNLSTRYPPQFKASGKCPQMLTDRPIPFRYRLGKGDQKNSSVLALGRYAVPAGTVYVLKKPLEEEHNTWWKFPNEWFPQSNTKLPEGQNTLLKQLGCGLCLPITIKGLEE